jgi:hypothetical protein
MGCSEAYLKQVSEQTNIPLSNMAVWSNSDSKKATYGYRKQREKLSNYYDGRVGGVVRCQNLFSDSPECVANFAVVEDALPTPEQVIIEK